MLKELNKAYTGLRIQLVVVEMEIRVDFTVEAEIILSLEMFPLPHAKSIILLHSTVTVGIKDHHQWFLATYSSSSNSRVLPKLLSVGIVAKLATFAMSVDPCRAKTVVVLSKIVVVSHVDSHVEGPQAVANNSNVSTMYSLLIITYHHLQKTEVGQQLEI